MRASARPQAHVDTPAPPKQCEDVPPHAPPHPSATAVSSDATEAPIPSPAADEAPPAPVGDTSAPAEIIPPPIPKLLRASTITVLPSQ